MGHVGHGTLCNLLQCFSVTYLSHIKLGLLIVVLLLLWNYLKLVGFHKIHVNTCLAIAISLCIQQYHYLFFQFLFSVCQSSGLSL